MEPISIAVMATVAFGAVASLAAFIRHLLLSRDKQLNEAAQTRAIHQEARELETLRQQMENTRRFQSHYQVLGNHSETIRYLDNKIEEVMAKKMALIMRYSEMSLKESSAIIADGVSPERKAICDLLKQEMDTELTQYNAEILQLQKRRAALWDSHLEIQNHLVDSERSRNEKLDEVYMNHSGILGKVYHRHDLSSHVIAKENISATSESYRISLLGPLHFLTQYFKPSTGIATDLIAQELSKRQDVKSFEDSLNDAEFSPLENHSDIDDDMLLQARRSAKEHQI